MPFWSKNPWEKVSCQFTVQEYDASVGKGWNDTTEATGEPPTIAEARDLFRPGVHYRVVARSMEDKGEFKAGKYIGVVWVHYEPLPGGVQPVKPIPKAAKGEIRQIDVVDVMDKYFTEVERVLTPIGHMAEALEKIRGVFFTPSPQGSGESGESSDYNVPPLEFDGKAPWMMHPMVVKTIFGELKGIIDYGATRLEAIMGKPEGATGEPAKEEAEPLLPSMDKYGKKEAEEPIIEEVPITPASPGQLTIQEMRTVPSPIFDVKEVEEEESTPQEEKEEELKEEVVTEEPEAPPEPKKTKRKKKGETEDE